LILLDEAHLAKVDDPAAGSGAVEALTEALAQTAWALFQEIERAGGLGEALERGLFQAKVETVRRERERRIAFRMDRLIGTSDFPDLAEKPVNVIMPSVSASPPPERPKTALPALAPMRLAEPFERLRDLSDARLAKEGARPGVFLANLGHPADFSARASYAKSFFEAGGIEAIGNDGFADAASLVAAFKATGARLACLCAGDATYAAQGPDVARALRAAGASRVFLAGQPNGREAALRQAGVTDFVHDGCNALAILEDAQNAA
jgi:methylmalonyl-CoA mutase